MCVRVLDGPLWTALREHTPWTLLQVASQLGPYALSVSELRAFMQLPQVSSLLAARCCFSAAAAASGLLLLQAAIAAAAIAACCCFDMLQAAIAAAIAACCCLDGVVASTTTAAACCLLLLLLLLLRAARQDDGLSWVLTSCLLEHVVLHNQDNAAAVDMLLNHYLR